MQTTVYFCGECWKQSPSLLSLLVHIHSDHLGTDVILPQYEGAVLVRDTRVFDPEGSLPLDWGWYGVN